MIYPDLPYKNKKVDKLLTKFYGLNLTDNTAEGEFCDAQGISTRNYPMLTQRKGRESVSGYTNITDVFEWNGKLVVVDSSVLYYDGQAITNVTPGKKQFAVVNTHLIVLPDQLDIDLTSGSYTVKNMMASMSTVAGPSTCTFKDGNKISGTVAGYVGHIQLGNYVCYDGGSRWGGSSINPLFYTYGTTRSAVEACYSNGAWDQTSLNNLKTIKNVRGVWGASAIAQGDIIIPGYSNNLFSFVTGSYKSQVQSGSYIGVVDTYPTVSNYNAAGVYGVINCLDDDEDVDWYEYYEYDSQGRIYYGFHFCNVGIDLYSAGTRLWSDLLSVGDCISCTGATGDYNFSKALITSIDDSTNTMTVASMGSTDTPFPTTEQSYSTSVTFTCQFPELDFICEKANRLWGISNAEKTIYASALGLPNQMYSSGTDSDAYQVAIGSEGDFTGMVNFGGAVCCFKENKVHKILGDVPSTFYMTDYTIDGVQSGSDKSIVNINETLYYKGKNGVYAWTGSTPTLISSKLGREVFTDGVGGSDGERYYLHVKDSSNKHYLLTYDLQNGLWMKEDNITASAFATTSYFYMVSNGAMYKLNLDNSEQFDWYAEFVPFYAMRPTSSSYTRTLGKQGYSKLTIGFEMETGSRFTVEIKEDNKLWKKVYTKTADKNFTTMIPINMGRCDIFRLKLSGYGKVKIFALEREYTLGSKV